MEVDVIINCLPRISTLPNTSATTLVGLGKRRKNVLKLLTLEDKEEIVVVVLHGMGGVGKSTLAEVVYNEASMSRERCCCRIEVGENPTAAHITSLQRKMVEDLTGESLRYMQGDKARIEEKLRHRVFLNKSGEPFLLYIDNLFQTEDLEKLINLDCELMEIPKGSRLLVTTRDKSVCSRVFKRNRHFSVREFSVGVLSDKDARRLFYNHAFGEEEPRVELVKNYDAGEGQIGSMVHSVCGNLPLALRVLGRSLTGERQSVWRNKSRELMAFRDSEFERKVAGILESSFNSLDLETQTAFLIACVCFCDGRLDDFMDCVKSLFPKAAATRLFELGLLESSQLHVEGRGYCFVLKMHDLVRNLGFQLATKRKHAYPNKLTCEEDFANVKEEAAWHEVKWLRVPALEEGIEAELLEKCEELQILVLHTRVNGHIGKPPQHLKAFYSGTTSRVSIEIGNLKELAIWTDYDNPRKGFPGTPSTGSTLQVFYGLQGPHISEDAVDCHRSTLRKLSCHRIRELSSYFCEKMTRLQGLVLFEYEGKGFPKEMGSLVGLEFLYVRSVTIRELRPESLLHLKRLQLRLHLKLQNLK